MYKRAATKLLLNTTAVFSVYEQTLTRPKNWYSSQGKPSLHVCVIKVYLYTLTVHVVYFIQLKVLWFSQHFTANQTLTQNQLMNLEATESSSILNSLLHVLIGFSSVPLSVFISLNYCMYCIHLINEVCREESVWKHSEVFFLSSCHWKKKQAYYESGDKRVDMRLC